MLWPREFGYTELQKEFESACDAICIYGTPREDWKTGLPLWQANYIWNKAKEILK